MQDATPLTLGDEFSGYSEQIKNDLDNPRYATSLGSINFGIQNQDKPINNKSNFSIKMIDKIKNFLNELY